MALNTIIATVQGQEVELTYNEATGYYEGTGQAGSDSSFPQNGGYFTGSITATDDSGLSTTVDSDDFETLRLFVYEEKAPTIEIITPASGAYITNTTKPEIQFKIVDNSVQKSGYSGVNKGSVVLTVGGVQADSSLIEWEDTDGGYIGTYTPETDLADGEITITVSGADNDGNSAETASVTFKIDNLAPELNVTSPANGLVTSQSEVVVAGTTSDTSTPINVKITLNGNVQFDEEVTGGAFSKTINLITEGNNIIVVTATDASGKSTEQTITVRYNTTAPVFEEVEILYEGSQVSATNKVPAGGQYTIRCKVTTS